MAAAAGGGIPSAMRAWQYSKYGGGADALELKEGVAVPQPAAGELLVRVQAASVNPVDWKLQTGMARPFLPPSIPCTPGLDLAGEVVAVGSAVAGFAKGDQISGKPNALKSGAFADYAVVPASAAAKRPPQVPAAEAACFGVAGLTALQFLRDWGKLPVGPAAPGSSVPPPGNVLVTNASGGVGHYAVQLAKLGGNFVTATCGQRNAEWVKSLGADEVLDYKTPEGAALKSPSGKKYDVLLDGTTDLKWGAVKPVLATNGKWVHLTPNPTVLFDALWTALTLSKQRVYTGFVSASSADLALLGQLSAEGKLKTRIDAEVPFSSAPDAWRKSKEGHVVGKVVVVMDGQESKQ